MSYLLIIGSIALPAIMFWAGEKWEKVPFVFNLAALVSLLIFGNLASVNIYQIIKNNTVFMTNIHGLFLNPFFLITASYLGIYLIYQLINKTLKSM
ncbi:transposase [Gracilibacillus oryzae]|uniref:Transposase n=1 Tax=Gracilibacillus oryzae TaxID=1672701 RepID=A0A7C8GT02_9BACI|nr:transposase [Gracilibacillus oryzae]KAB8135763.1 transposase [Gracilibacillus oryzae]